MDVMMCPECSAEVAPLPNYRSIRDTGMCKLCAAQQEIGKQFRASRAAQELRWPTMRGDAVADVLGISPVNLRQLVHRGQITPMGRAGKWSYFDTDDVLGLCLRRGVTLVHTPNSHTEPQ